MSIQRVMLLSLVAFLAMLAYVQMMFVRGFAPVSVRQGKVDIELVPESHVYFGGLYWGFLRFDSEDQLFIRVIGKMAPNQMAEISIDKDGKSLSFLCKADKSGFCYETIQREDIKMSGGFTCSVKTEGRNFRGANTFKRKTKPIFLIHEAMMSV